MTGLDPARLIVCERTGRWAVALRRELTEAGVRVWETRSLADCWDELASSPASFLILELARNPRPLLDRLARLPRTFAAARAAVISDRSLAHYEWLLREAGAVHFVCSPRELAPLARIVCRHLAQAPASPKTLTEQIWAELPWGEQGSEIRDQRSGAREEGCEMGDVR